MDVKSRIEKIQRQMSADVLIIDDPIDLFYLTGLSVSVGRLAVFPSRACFFVDGRYIEQAKKRAPCEVKLREEMPQYMKGAKSGAYDSAFMTVDGLKLLEKTFSEIKWQPISKPLKTIRWVKEKGEIDALRRAALTTWKGYQHILTLLKEGVAEEDLALEFEIYCRKQGASKLSFSPIVAFGENSAYPHYRAGKTRLKNDQIALFDLGAVVDGYYGDMTRVVFFGKPDPQLEKDYHLIQRAQKRAVEAVRPGVRFGELDKIARDEIKKSGADHLFTHGLSHGIGLEGHEPPFLRIDGGDADLILEPGMAFTVEPGIYRPGLGGVRYEDTVVVTGTGVENFFTGAP